MIFRRNFMKITAAALVGGSTGCLFGSGKSEQKIEDHPGLLPTPSKGQMSWQDAEVGLLYSFDLPIAAGNFAPNNNVRKRLDPGKYNPVKLDTDKWLEVAKAAGAGYAVFTATHFNGFMQWQSDLYPYGLKQAKWKNGKGDVVGDFVASCRKVGIKPGIYLSTHRNAFWSVWGHYVNWGKGKGTDKQAVFNRIAEKMTEELCSRYGELIQIWFDAGVKTPKEGGPDVLPVFERYQPGSVFYHNIDRSDHRWIGNEQGHAGVPCWATMPGLSKGPVSHNSRTWSKYLHGGDPAGTVWSPGMVDVPLRGSNGIHHWFWKPRAEKGVLTSAQLLEMYHKSVGRNCNFVIGVVVKPDGSIPVPDAGSLAAFGRELRRSFGKPIAETRGNGRLLELSLPSPRKIDHLVIMEDITYGERIRRYIVETLVHENKWQQLCEGQSVGHKRIHRFSPVEVSVVRLRIVQERAAPKIRRFAILGVATKSNANLAPQNAN